MDNKDRWNSFFIVEIQLLALHSLDTFYVQRIGESEYLVSQTLEKNKKIPKDFHCCFSLSSDLNI